ncbi:NAD-dependent epimerase/dehydratase family protein [uncultured Kordia sp.]|uniref:NAD-dependent epimerase/dehydratase family protein n=1 Tax=uncultured Kordia sp. TaxID=507699 RepID=UPI002638DB07|nr:NAD-dependent epimerase/dehydratase family protein [uncultured Kordia sp.]
MEKILVLGGTQFIGRTLVEQLQKLNKYDITLFNRQQTQADLFPQLKKIKGDRETDDVRQIENGHWDYIIDVSCYYPDSLSNVLKSIKGTLKKYILVSTCSVYDNEHDQSILRDETTKILSCTDAERTDRTNASYGNRKAECERILKHSTQEYLMLRPSLVYGAYDHTDRFYYWLYQTKKHTELLLPDFGKRVFSLTYVQDLVQTILNGIELPVTGIYNVITAQKTSIQQIVNSAAKHLHTTFETVNATPDFLHQQDINQWFDMPLWLDCDYHTYDNTALKNDLQIVPTDFEESVKETIEYYDALGWKEPIYGMSETTRLALIAKLNC